MNAVVRVGNKLVTSNAALRAELRKAGIPVFRQSSQTVGRVGTANSSRRKVRTTFVTGIEAVQYGEGAPVKIEFSTGWTNNNEFTPEQIADFIARSIEIAKSLGFVVRN